MHPPKGLSCSGGPLNAGRSKLRRPTPVRYHVRPQLCMAGPLPRRVGLDVQRGRVRHDWPGGWWFTRVRTSRVAEDCQGALDQPLSGAARELARGRDFVGELRGRAGHGVQCGTGGRLSAPGSVEARRPPRRRGLRSGVCFHGDVEAGTAVIVRGCCCYCCPSPSAFGRPRVPACRRCLSVTRPRCPHGRPLGE
jgi:hypothetical protein